MFLPESPVRMRPIRHAQVVLDVTSRVCDDVQSKLNSPSAEISSVFFFFFFDALALKPDLNISFLRATSEQSAAIFSRLLML